MDTVEQNISNTLRTLAREGVSPSEMLREVVYRVGADNADRQFLVRAISTAFRFEEGEGYVIFGWLPDGTGALTDAQLDYLLSKRIESTRLLWDD